MNLLDETKKILNAYGKSISDIEWFGNSSIEYICDLEKLIDLEYNSSYVFVEIPEDFILVGADFWIERHERDGSEWWEYKTMPKKPDKAKVVSKLID